MEYQTDTVKWTYCTLTAIRGTEAVSRPPWDPVCASPLVTQEAEGDTIHEDDEVTNDSPEASLQLMRFVVC